MERSANLFRGMSEKLYILSVSRGSWDDYHRINIGAFDSKEKADKAGKEFLELRAKAIADMEDKCPIEKSVHLKIEEDYDSELLDSMDVETINTYYRWKCHVSGLAEINNEYRVEPLYVNTMDLSVVFGGELSD
jgi:hypothetical protein